jgi:hypothetical protein
MSRRRQVFPPRFFAELAFDSFVTWRIRRHDISTVRVRALHPSSIDHAAAARPGLRLDTSPIRSTSAARFLWAAPKSAYSAQCITDVRGERRAAPSFVPSTEKDDYAAFVQRIGRLSRPRTRLKGCWTQGPSASISLTDFVSSSKRIVSSARARTAPRQR